MLDVAVENVPSTPQMEKLVQENALLLIPYDCDKNHHPSNRRGRNSHWCLVVSFFFSQSKNVNLKKSEEMKWYIDVYSRKGM